MKKGKSAIVVVEVNGKFMGSAGVARKPLDATSHVCTLGLGIHSTIRNRGIGTILMQTLMELGRDVLKCRIAELSVYEPNAIARRVYEKSGFRETGRIPKGCNYYGKFYDETIMVREL
jgi:RimJ/RimL family protein N-acetyltransferase